jgi:hypothetical protein
MFLILIENHPLKLIALPDLGNPALKGVCREAAWRRQPELNRVILVRGVVTGISRYGLIGSANPIPFPAKPYPLKAF